MKNTRSTQVDAEWVFKYHRHRVLYGKKETYMIFQVTEIKCSELLKRAIVFMSKKLNARSTQVDALRFQISKT